MSDADARSAAGRGGLNRSAEAVADGRGTAGREGPDRPADAAAEARGAEGREGLNRPVEAAAETRGGAERPAGPTGAESRGAGPSGGASVTRLIEERDGAVLILTIDQPARRNALAMPIRAAMISALEHAQTDSAIRAVVVTGSGGHFCSGGDIAGMEVNSAMAGRERMRLSHQLIRLMVLGSLPVVAAVEGYCVGAGLSLACASDTVVAAEDARFGAGFGKIGLMADLGLPHTLPLRVGQGRARQILLYHGQMTAPEAERIGLVDHVVPKGHALQAALEKARFLAEQAPAPMALTKQMLGEGLDRALEQERHFQATLFLTEDFAEGRAAFLAKRTPIFKGA